MENETGEEFLYILQQKCGSKDKQMWKDLWSVTLRQQDILDLLLYTV